ncbi:MAG TPA: hypothetical protein VN643_07020 [Pyrinomonadaceae bacterium]|nr:hypothetical protein [Pyrinomonadaceae bacterium]
MKTSTPSIVDCRLAACSTKWPYSVSIAALVLFSVLGAPAQWAQSRKAGARITSTRVVPIEGSLTGRLFVEIRGKEKFVASGVIDVWSIRNGRQVVYSGMDGSGGFENEGQSLRVYDAATGKRRKILSEYFGINKVTEVTTTRNKTALLVDMADGGLGASYLAVVDPDRGEVFFRRWVRVESQQGDNVVIGHYKEDDWDKLNSDQNAKITPYKTESLNLNSILRGRVIIKKRIA